MGPTGRTAVRSSTRQVILRSRFSTFCMTRPLQRQIAFSGHLGCRHSKYYNSLARLAVIVRQICNSLVAQALLDLC